MVTNLGDTANGKENRPEEINADPRPIKPLIAKNKSYGMTQDKRKTVLGKDNVQPMEAVVMNMAFDKLLVSQMGILPLISPERPQHIG